MKSKKLQVGPGCSMDTWGRVAPTSGAVAALVRGPFADTALGTRGTAHRAAGAAAWGSNGKVKSEHTLSSNTLPTSRPDTSCRDAQTLTFTESAVLTSLLSVTGYSFPAPCLPRTGHRASERQ